MSGISIHASAREATNRRIDFICILRFQSTPPRGRRPYSITSFFPHAGFQSTPPRGRRPRTGNRIVNGMLFQSTPPRGRRQRIISTNGNISNFNPRLREGGDVGDKRECFGIDDFNPRLREGGDCIIFRNIIFCMISIHASAREATKNL